MSPSAWTRWSTWAWRTWRRCRRATRLMVTRAPGYDRRQNVLQLHLLFESICDLQLHEQNTLPDVQLLVQILEVGMDVLFDGSSLIGQLLEEFSDEVQGI